VQVLAVLYDFDVWHGHGDARGEHRGPRCAGNRGELNGASLSGFSRSSQNRRAGCILVARFGISLTLMRAQQGELECIGVNSAGSSRPWKHAAAAGTVPRCAPTSSRGGVPGRVAPLRRARRLHAVVHGKVVNSAPLGQRVAAAGRMLDDIQLVGIFVEGERGDRGAVAPLQIVPAPASPRARRESRCRRDTAPSTARTPDCSTCSASNRAAPSP